MSVHSNITASHQTVKYVGKIRPTCEKIQRTEHSHCGIQWQTEAVQVMLTFKCIAYCSDHSKYNMYIVHCIGQSESSTIHSEWSHQCYRQLQGIYWHLNVYYGAIASSQKYRYYISKPDGTHTYLHHTKMTSAQSHYMLCGIFLSPNLFTFHTNSLPYYL